MKNLKKFKFNIYFKIIALEILVILIMSILAPYLLNYPPNSEDKVFQGQIEPITHFQQYLSLGSLAIIIYIFFIKHLFKDIFAYLKKTFSQTGTNRYDWFPGYVGVLSKWSVYKAAPKQTKKESEKKARYLFYEHKENEKYLGFSLIINGILNVYYDKTRGTERRLGFALLGSGRGYDKYLGEIPYQKHR